MFHYLKIVSKKIEDLSELEFTSSENENLKKYIIEALLSKEDENSIKLKVQEIYANLIEEIQQYSSIQIILREKNEEAIIEFLDELLMDLKEIKNMQKIESLERDLVNNLDENSYSELIKLKSQLNRQ